MNKYVIPVILKKNIVVEANLESEAKAKVTEIISKNPAITNAFDATIDEEGISCINQTEIYSKIEEDFPIKKSDGTSIHGEECEWLSHSIDPDNVTDKEE